MNARAFSNPAEIRAVGPDQWQHILDVILDGATAYRGVIPDDCCHDPYMSASELRREMERISFFGWYAASDLLGVMGVEDVQDVTLVRHAYVRTESRRNGIGSALLAHAERRANHPTILIGTWQAATWAVDFYRKHGYAVIEDRWETSELLRRYWGVPPRQIETSVVLRKELARS